MTTKNKYGPKCSKYGRSKCFKFDMHSTGGTSNVRTLVHSPSTSQACSYQGRSLSKISIFGCHVSKIQKNGEQDYSPFGQSLIVEIDFQSPFCPLPNPLCDSLFFITPPQQPTERTTTKMTTIEQTTTNDMNETTRTQQQPLRDKLQKQTPTTTQNEQPINNK